MEAAFRAYDIRGIYNQDFTKEDVYKIGYFLPRLLDTNKVLVGQDVRQSSNEIYEFLSTGIRDAGAYVYNMGLATTPMVYFATQRYKFKASIMITASHNSAEYNGLKISRENAIPVGYESGMKDLLYLIHNEILFPHPTKGRQVIYDLRSDYTDFLKQYLADIGQLRIGVDGSNGMTGLIIRQILGESPYYINEKPDGAFPNHPPNPLNEANTEQLKQLVRNKNCDIGLIFDGDGDRVVFIDEQGRFISPDLIIAVLSEYLLEKQKGVVIQDIRTSKSVTEYLQKKGADVHIWKVGHSFAKLKLRELDGVYGGELAGHYYYRDFFYCDSGILTALHVLRIVSALKRQGQTISDLINRIVRYAFSGEINYKVEDKQAAMEALKTHFSKEETPERFYDFDGYRLDFKDWWFNIRPSNTEPYLRLVVEAQNDEMLQERIAAIDSVLVPYK